MVYGWDLVPIVLAANLRQRLDAAVKMIDLYLRVAKQQGSAKQFASAWVGGSEFASAIRAQI